MFVSFRLSDTETRYPTGEREALGIVKTLAECNWLLLPSPHATIVYCDHRNLLYVFANNNNNKGRLAAWSEALGHYDFVIQHRPNTTKVIRIADGFSRLSSKPTELAVRELPNRLDFILEATPTGPERPPQLTTLEEPKRATRVPKREPTGCYVQVNKPTTTAPALLARISREGTGTRYPLMTFTAKPEVRTPLYELQRQYGSTE
jgi:hypothetical protein